MQAASILIRSLTITEVLVHAAPKSAGERTTWQKMLIAAAAKKIDNENVLRSCDQALD